MIFDRIKNEAKKSFVEWSILYGLLILCGMIHSVIEWFVDDIHETTD